MLQDKRDVENFCQKKHFNRREVGAIPFVTCRSEGIFALRLLKIFKKVIKSKALYFAIAMLIQLTILFVLINEMDFNHFF